MKNGETISKFQTRTTKPKITTIKESKNLATMTMETLFRKLLSYEHELTQQSYVEETKKKRKGIALKVNYSKEEYKDSSNSEEDAENFNLMVRKFGKFLRKSKYKKFSKSSQKIENNNNNSYTCFECGKQGYIKFECPIYLRKHVGEKKRKKDRKQKKAYIAWEDSASTTSDSSSDEEITNICLTTKSMNDPSTNEKIEVFLKARDSLWYLDNGCSRHITGDKSKLSDFVYEGYITFGDLAFH